MDCVGLGIEAVFPLRLVDRILLFRGMDRTIKLKLAKSLVLKRFTAGQHVFEEGEDARCMYFIIRGTAKVIKKTSSGEDSVVATLYPPQFFGEMAFIDLGKRSASICACEELLLAELSWDNFRSIIKEMPEFALFTMMEIAKTLSIRLRKATTKYTCNG